MKKIVLALLIVSNVSPGQEVKYDDFEVLKLSNSEKGYSHLSIFEPKGAPVKVVSALDWIDVISLQDDALTHEKYEFIQDLENVGILSSDMNQDGIMDLVVGSYWSNRVSIYMGLSEGTFADPVHYPLDGHCYGFTVGYINDDEFPDVVGVRNGSGQAIAIHVFINDGQGGLSRTFFHDAEDHTNNEVYITDLNNDGKNDILIRSINGFVLSYLQNAVDDFDFNYIPIMPYFPGGPITIPGGRAIVNEDFDMDGFDDLAIAYQDSLIIRKGNGDGSFQEKSFYKYDDATLTNLAMARLNQADMSLLATRVDNLNASNADSLFVFRFDHVANELIRTHAIQLPRKLGYVRDQLKVTDLNEDGIEDIVILAENNELLILKGEGDPVTGIPDEPEIEVRLYPNPTTGRVFVDTRQLVGKPLTLDLLSTSNQVLVSRKFQKVTEPLLEVDIETAGQLFFLKLNSAGKVWVKRIIVSNKP